MQISIPHDVSKHTSTRVIMYNIIRLSELTCKRWMQCNVTNAHEHTLGGNINLCRHPAHDCYMYSPHNELSKCTWNFAHHRESLRIYKVSYIWRLSNSVWIVSHHYGHQKVRGVATWISQFVAFHPGVSRWPTSHHPGHFNVLLVAKEEIRNIHVIMCPILMFLCMQGCYHDHTLASHHRPSMRRAQRGINGS